MTLTAPVIFNDVVALTRALTSVPHGEQYGLADLIIERAKAAQDYRRKTGRRHPAFGTGNIEAACHGRQDLGIREDWSDLDWLEAHKVALDALHALAMDERDAREDAA